MKYIISGGGTGGHIFPAISIANAIAERDKSANILFVGANGRMEMERVPKAGYSIKGLPVRGFERKKILKNIGVILDLLKSTRQAEKIVREFKPHIAIGVGGYASAPTLRAAAKQGVPTLIQEQNSYAGVTNKLLAKKAEKICVAYLEMDKFFPKEKIVLTGNPVRKELLNIHPKAEEAYRHFNLNPEKKTLLIIGGSLGAKTINQSILGKVKELKETGIQVIWQTGKYYIKQIKNEVKDFIQDDFIVTDFVSRMDYAYAIADLVISRAGASSISELSLLGKPAILVPSPNVAEDHQTKNAQALSTKDAAILIPDDVSEKKLVTTAINLIKDERQLKILANNIIRLGEKDSANRIVDEVFDIIKK